jgi:sugar lactone lactonase YvrE
MNGFIAGKPGWQRVLLFSMMLWLTACGSSDNNAPPSTPAITAQPADVSVVAGTDATFNVTATGESPRYQWQTSNDSGASWADIPGAMATGYTFTSVAMSDSGHLFRVLVSAAGATVSSLPAYLTVMASAVAPAITVQPANQTVTEPSTATLSVTATGTSPSYQWQLSTDGGTSWANIGGETSSSYTTPATVASASGAQFRVQVSNSVGSVTSSAATLTVTAGSGGGGFAGYYTVGGQMQGLLADMTWTGLRLYVTPPGGSRQYYDISVGTNGNFVFDGVVQHPQTGVSTYFAQVPLPAGSQYEVRLGSAPNRRCSIANGSGTLNADVRNISVNCQPLWVETIATAMADKVAQGVVVHDNPGAIASDPGGNLYIGGAWLDDFATAKECYLRKIATDGSDSVQISGSCDGTGSAPFFYPESLAAAADGSVYVYARNVIYKWSAGGGLSLLAGGDAVAGFADGTGAAARFNPGYGWPGLAVDAAGTVYVADAGNQRIRQITPAGVVTTLSGDGSTTLWNNPQGVAVDGNGVVHVANTGKNEIRTVVAATGETGTSIDLLTQPKYIAATPAGDNYVLQVNKYNILLGQADAYQVSVAAGDGNVLGTNDGRADQARFYYLSGIASDASGRAFVLEAHPAPAGASTAYIKVVRRISTTPPASH